MKLQTFQAESTSAALALVKRELGEHAVIVNTRFVRQGGVLGIGARTVVEITATDEPRVVERVERRLRPNAPRPPAAGVARQPPAAVVARPSSARFAQPPSAALLEPDAPRAAPLNASAEANYGRMAYQAAEKRPERRGDTGLQPVLTGWKPAPQPELEPTGDVAGTHPRAAVASPPAAVAASPAAPPPSSLFSEIAALRGMVRDVLREQHRNRLPEAPGELVEFYSQLIRQQVADELARQVIDEARRATSAGGPDAPDLAATAAGAIDGLTARPAAPADAGRLRAAVLDRIAALLPPVEPLSLNESGRTRVAALVGPTGVGKTTTIAKLAAHFKLRERRRVGLITVDTYRIAAAEQLKVYANILDVPLKVVMSPAQMGEAVAGLRDCDLVLIDTAGRAPRNTMLLDDLRRHLDAAAPDEVHLVLSGTSNESTVREAIEQFGRVRPNRVIFTKLDEAAGLGLIFNVLTNADLRISYLTTGQSVPNDIESASAPRLARLILGVERADERPAVQDSP